jgi:hypothetical protein
VQCWVQENYFSNTSTAIGGFRGRKESTPGIAPELETMALSFTEILKLMLLIKECSEAIY